MIKQSNDRWWLMLNTMSRGMLVYAASSWLPIYIVTEYPKSGGTWVSQMLAEYFDIPFPRNRLPKLRSAIMHGHYLYFPTMRRVFVVMRDGRDVMLSLYYHCLVLRDDQFNAPIVAHTQKALPFADYDDVRANLPQFIDYLFTSKRHPRFTWPEFVNSWSGKNAPFLYYEKLLHDPVRELGGAIAQVANVHPDEQKLEKIIDKYSFKNQTSRNPGEEDKQSFLRKGIAGDWKNHFSPEARKVFHAYAGQELIKLGYEHDDRWVEQE